MKILFLGKNKPAVCAALKYLIDSNVKIAAVAASCSEKPPLYAAGILPEITRRCGIPFYDEAQLYELINRRLPDDPERERIKDVDIAISFLFPKRFRKELLELPKSGCVNFHPAPLPEFRGVCGYSLAIYEGVFEWGVSAHFMDESFDTGDIIKVNRFSIDSEEETAFSLEQKSLSALVELLKEVVHIFNKTGSLPKTPQGTGRYITKEEFERLRKVHPNETIGQIRRKARAFWYPPYPGAYMEKDGKEIPIIYKDTPR